MDVEKYISPSEILKWMASMSNDDIAHQISYLRQDEIDLKLAIGAKEDVSIGSAISMISQCKKIACMLGSSFIGRIRSWTEDPLHPDRSPSAFDLDVVIRQVGEAYAACGERANGYNICQHLEYLGWTVDGELVSIINESSRSGAIAASMWMARWNQWM